MHPSTQGHMQKSTQKHLLCVCVVSLLKINFTSILELNILLQVTEFLTQFVPNTIIQNLCNTPERSPHDARGICIRINAKKMSSTFLTGTEIQNIMYKTFYGQRLSLSHAHELFAAIFIRWHNTRGCAVHPTTTKIRGYQE